MEKIQLADDLFFSKIVHGLWRLAEWNLTSDQTLSLIKSCMELGITTFDHADIYGDYTCESLFGEALRKEPSLREGMQLVTKCGIKLLSKNRPENKVHHYDTSKQHILNSVDQSLKNLHTDFIDVLLIHRPDPYMNPEEVAESFSILKEQGKVRHFGVSNFTPSQFSMLQSYLDFSLVTNQVEISVSHLDAFQDGTIDQCLERRVSPMVWSPLAGGSIFKADDEKSLRIKSVLEDLSEELGVQSIDIVMYAWLLSHPAKLIPIVGSGKLERIRVAIEALSIELTREQWFKIWIASTGKEVA
ncbi:aldo/keto reductase [Bacillus massilinigeriensis]|uniref:aldo/keto reductase n=1 Tax=Bacillus massilionigeriensis TaxID=1805475 RepID=UPI00096B0D11|nr:aldo/keto reductase family oxidoreductase [Bacillus massilionigeriensis]